MLILHGDNQLQSRLALNQTIKAEQSRGVKEIIHLDGKALTPTTLHQALESQSLFGDSKLVIIENLHAHRSSRQKQTLIKLLAKHSGRPRVLLWENKNLTAAQLKKLKNFRPQLFKNPVIIFQFLDSLKPNNPKTLIQLFHQSLKASASEQIFYMLHRRISQLIQAKDAPQELKLASWQKTRLISQAKLFTLNQLLTLHSKLLTIDESIKTGTSPIPLNHALELFLSDL